MMSPSGFKYKLNKMVNSIVRKDTAAQDLQGRGISGE